ncbi:MAG: CHAT domain-containing protein [Lewinellaceae bacterium]|nr:CHAT domain-containing protein [Lewinellaceae bacterium]
MNTPIIFMAFANDPKQPLPGLEKESEAIYRTLTEGAKNLFFQLHREPFATTENIAHYLIEFKDQVVIFHYGGHAGSEELVLLDQVADAKGIAQLLKGQSNLKLVFLNGCSTQQQVKLLVELGVPAVIATSTPIDNEKAILFAEQFYFALSKKFSIGEAFDAAAGFLQAKGVKAEHFRGFQTQPEAATEMPWGMYTSTDEVLNWKLPEETANKKQIIVRHAADQFNFSKSPVNSRLTETLIAALRPYSKKMELLFASMEDGEEVDERILGREVIDSLPAPIGEQVRKLFSLEATPDQLDKIGLPRLEQLVMTYQTLLEFFSFLLLAEMWEAKIKNKDLSVSKEMLDQVRLWLIPGQKEAEGIDLSQWIQQILEGLDKAKLFAKPGQLFMEELPTLLKTYREDETFQVSCNFMEEMRQEVNSGKVSADEVESFCVQAEEHLSNLFSAFAFCARYKLNSIKRIVIQKPRNKLPRYFHYKVKLDTITAGYKDVIKDYEEGFTEDKSVVLLKGEKEFGPYLNLSPFLIDENALKDEEKSKLFFFNWYDRDKDAVHYKYANVQKDELVLTDQYPQLREELDEFCQSFFGKPYKQL